MSNIEVIVRCRGRNDREVASKSPVVVEIPQEGGTTVSLAPARSSASFLDQINSKSYSVDKAYGSGSAQQELYTQVAHPLVRDFLSGYNVTILAYGQTGTGKTYTMCGGGFEQAALKDDAGIIPRVLVDLFQSLASSKNRDYVVKCSFLELYNEELKDLFREEGLSNGATSLRIYEAKKRSKSTSNNLQANGLQPQQLASGQSIYVQGLLEIHVSDAQYALELLQKGVARRMTASTKMNEHSSRSHTIFSINLYNKAGDIDHYQVSKMNLVDLAGSENISRSGSINQRAKEAGLINQSLLTLGRVINSLVSDSSNSSQKTSAYNNSHIPYRESKLTRLLQDSLGGETKTALIATISPAKVNFDETTSTLEYASRAKNIKNKPQLGEDSEFVLKKTMVRDLSKEIIRLSDDLNASRQKNGIWMDERNHKTLLLEQESLKTELKESQLIINSLYPKIDDLQQNRVSNEGKIKTLEKANEELEMKFRQMELESRGLLNTIEVLKRQISKLSNELTSVNQENRSLNLIMAGQIDVVDDILESLKANDQSQGLRDLDRRLYESSNATRKKLENIKSDLTRTLNTETPKLLDEIQQVNDQFGDQAVKLADTQSDNLDDLRGFNEKLLKRMLSELVASGMVKFHIDKFINEKVAEKFADIQDGLKRNMNLIFEEANSRQSDMLKDVADECSRELVLSQNRSLNSMLDEWKGDTECTIVKAELDIESLRLARSAFNQKLSLKINSISSSLSGLIGEKLAPTLNEVDKEMQNSSVSTSSVLEQMEKAIVQASEAQMVQLRNLQVGRREESVKRSRLPSPLRPALLAQIPNVSPEKGALLKSKIPQLSRQNSIKKQKL